MDRGQIINRERAKQLRDFSGLHYGTITPTDLDGFIDFGDKAFIFFELKVKGTPLLIGQRLALERLVNSAIASGRKALAIVAEHDTLSDMDIDVANCIVVETKEYGDWKTTKSLHTLKYVIDYFLKVYFPNNQLLPSGGQITGDGSQISP